MQAMARVRDRLVQRRIALINEIRGFLLERGITFAVRPIHLRKLARGHRGCRAEPEFASAMAAGTFVAGAEARWRATSKRLATRSSASATQTPFAGACARSPVSAAGLQCNRRRYRQCDCLWPRARLRSLGGGRAMAILLRGKRKLLGIHKRGNLYLRRMLIHGARAVLFRIKYEYRRFRGVGASPN